MYRKHRYIKQRVQEASKFLFRTLDEATCLTEAIILQQAGSNLDKYKNLDIKKTSIDSLNGVLYTLKSLIKDKLYFLDELIDNEREFCLKTISKNEEFAKIIQHTFQLNLISDNNDISLYLSPYIEDWHLLTAGVRLVILNQVIKNINAEIQRVRISEELAKRL